VLDDVVAARVDGPGREGRGIVDFVAGDGGDERLDGGVERVADDDAVGWADGFGCAARWLRFLLVSDCAGFFLFSEMRMEVDRYEGIGTYL
jgi:hypothetical protein